MPKGKIPPFFDTGVKHNNHTDCSHPTGEQSFRVPPRMAVLTSMKIPYLRRSDLESGDSARTHKTPLLTLKLSSHSFLDSTLKDDLSPYPLYTIQTIGTTTTIVRADPWEASTKTADIKWPKLVPVKTKGKRARDDLLVRLNGSRWKGGQSFLKPPVSKNGPHKFNIPHYSHSMKWQKHGMAYWCTTGPVKGPIAIFDPAVDSLPGRLSVYETLHDKYETSPMLVHQGVSIFLLDYLLLTLILLVTDVQEWMVVQSSGHSSPSPTNDPNPNAGLQWRKIAHGEPLFPKLSPAVTQHATPGGFDCNPATPTSPERMAKIVHGDPLYPHIQHASTSRLSFSSDSEAEGTGHRSFLDITRTRSPTPIESLHPPSNMSPSPTHLDPSFDLDHDALTFSSPSSSQHPSQARLISPVSTRPRLPRELPTPPPLPASSEPLCSWSHLSQSLNEINNQSQGFDALGATGPADASLWKRRPSEPVITRSRSISRPLPRTPSNPNIDRRDPAIRRAQSHTRINQADAEKPWLLGSASQLPPLPALPSTARIPRTGRTLPPTPLDLAMGRTVGVATTTGVDGTQQLWKSSESEEDPSRWVQILAGEQRMADTAPRPSFDQPPPAYNSINFNETASQSWISQP